VAYYELLVSSDVTLKKLPIERPILDLTKDYDEGVLNSQLVLPFVENKLKIDSYSLKAQANPLRTISFAGTLCNE